MKKIVFAMAAAALLAMSSAAQATPLPPGGTVVPDISPETGALVTSTGAIAFDTGGGLKGTVQESVFRELTGTLDFVYQVTNSAASSDVVEHVTGAPYNGFTTNVSQFSSAPGFAAGTVLATTANRPTLGNGGHTVSFNFLDPGAGNVLPGETSYVVIVRTNAVSFKGDTIGVIDGSATTLKGFAPAPEPTSLVLFGGLALGMGGAGLRRWRQRKAVTA